MKKNILANIRVWVVMMICLTVLGAGNAWGTDVTFTFNTDDGIAELGISKPNASNGTNLDTSNPYVKSGVSMAVTNGGTATRVWNSGGTLDLRVYSSAGSLTFTAPGNITDVVISGNTVNGFSANVGTYTTSTGTWEGDAASVTFTASSATQKVNTITVTYTASDPYTVTFNPQGGTCPYAAEFTQTTPSYQIEEVSGGAGITLPHAAPSAACASEGWAFYGWATAQCASTPTAPTIVGKAGDTYYPSNNTTTLHAVYATGEYTKETSAITSGAKYLIVANSTKNYIMTDQYSLDDGEGQMASVQIDETSSNKYHASAVNANWCYTIEGTAGNYYIRDVKNDDESNYIDIAFKDWYEREEDSGDAWTITGSSGNWTLQNNWFSNVLAFDGTNHVFVRTSGTVLLYKQTTTPSYNSNPSCVTTYTVTINKNNDSYGTITETSVSGLTSGTAISASDNVLTIGTGGSATNVTATANTGYKFTGWTGIPVSGTVTDNITVTANFAARTYTNYRTRCSDCAAPTAVTTTAVGKTSVTLSITDAENAGNYDIYISTASTSPTSETTPTTTVNTKTPTISTGLSACTTYNLWVRAKCSESSKSGWVALTGSTFATTGTAPTVGAGGATALSSTSGQVTCTAGITAIGETITSYGYCWGTSSNPTISDSHHELGTTYTVASTAFDAYTITGLTANETYHVRPYATNCGGTSYGTEATFTTSFKTIYFQPQSSWTANSPKTFIYDVTNSNFIAGEMTIGSGCYAGYLYKDVPSNCGTVVFVRMAPAATEGAWSGGNFWSQSVNVNVSSDNLFTMEGWGTYGDDYGKAYGSISTFALASYSVSYGGNGNTSGTMSNSAVTCGNNVTLTSNAYGKAGYSFGGWTANVDVTINGSPVSAGNPIADGAILESVGGNVGLTAIWNCVSPVITGQPSSANYSEGDSPSALSVTASLATGTLTYLWKVSTDNGSNWSDASGTNNEATYAAANISTAAAGTTKYKCVLTNSTGSCSVETDVATITVVADPRERFTLLTSSNVGQLSDGAKLVLINSGRTLVMNETQNSTNGHEQTSTGWELLSSNTILAVAENNPQSVQILELVETATANVYALYTGSTKNNYLCNTASNKLGEANDYSASSAQWTISVDGNGYAVIDAQGGQSQQIGYNADASNAKFRCYASGYAIYAYFKPSSKPSVTLTSSLSKFEYAHGSGPSTNQLFTVSGTNLSADLVVSVPSAAYEVSKDGSSGWGSSVSYEPSTGTVSSQTVYIRLKAGLGANAYDYAAASGLRITSTGATEKNTALTGEVKYSVSISSNNGSYGSVSPTSTTARSAFNVTATPESGHRVSSGASGYTVTSGTAEVVNNGDNTFTITPTSNCEITINFEVIVMYNVVWKVNGENYTTGGPSSSVESGSKWSTLSLPTPPSNTTLSECERTNFVGWSASQWTGDGNSAPSDLFKTTSDANADTHTISGNTTFHAVFAKGGDDESWIVDGSNITAPGSGTGYARYNGDHELSGIGYTTSQVMPSSSNLQFQASAGYLYNTTAMPADITSIVLTVNTLEVYEGTSTITSAGGLTPITPTGSGPYTYTFSSGKRFFHLKEPDSGASVTTVTVNYQGTGTDYVTSCACAWQINYITNGKDDGEEGATWSTDNCFLKVGNTNEWQIENFAMPDVDGQFWVGPGYFKGAGDWGHSVIADLSTVKYVLRSDKTRTSYSALTNMIGTLNIWSDGTDDNYHVGIYPDYQITYGVDGGSDPWTKVNFNYVSSTTYETDVVTAPTYFEVANFKYYVGVKTNGNTGWGGKSNTVLMNTMSGMTSNQDGKHGKWRMNEASNSNNWSCAWVPYYILSYDANEGSGAPAAEEAVSSEESVANRTKIVSSTEPTRAGYTFRGWNTDPDGEGTAKAAGDEVIMTSDVTLYAQWAQNFTVSYELDGGEADPVCSSGTYYVGQNVTVCSSTPTRLSSSFNGWKANVAVSSTGGTDYAVGALIPGGTVLVMPASNLTLTADYTTVYWHITYHDESDDNIAGITSDKKDVPQGMSITLPSMSPCPGYTFYGWSTSKYAEETTNKGTVDGTLIGKGGASYTPAADVTVYPVYKRVEGYTQKKDTLTTANTGVTTSYAPISGIDKNDSPKTIHSDAVYAIGAYNSSGMQFTDATDTEDKKKSSLVVTISGGTLESVAARFPNGNSTPRYLYIVGNTSNYTMQNRSSQTAGTLVATLTYNPNPKVTLWLNSGDLSGNAHTAFYMYSGGTTKADSIIVTWGTGTAYYATHCDLSENVTITYDGNGGTVGCGSPEDGTVTTVTWAYADGGMSAPTLASSQTICNSATRAGHLFNRWNTAPDGSGRDYAGGATVTKFGGDSTLYAIWDRVYTVTLYDNGVKRTELVQASAGATVTLPSGNNCGGESPFTFEGWTESAVELNADPVRPTTLHAAGAWEPTSDITLYSVYSRLVDGCEDFAAGVSGAYKMYNNATSDYALTTGGSSSSYGKGSSGTAEIFYISYAPAKSAYTIRTSAGYLGWSGTGSGTALTKTNTTPYYWLITVGNSGNWNFQPISESGRQFSGNNTTFQIHTNSTKYYIRLEKTAMTYYYNTALCGNAQITFHDGGGSISGTPTTPEGASWNSTTHVLSGLENCDKITTFPTASYDGWTFIGWSTEDYINSGKHTEGTSQYATENASTDEPDASIIYKTGGNSYVVRGGSIDLYPVFTRFPENKPFDLEAGGTYYMYYLDEESDDGYGSPARRYAGEWDGTKRYTATTTCANATEFAFTKVGDVWHIQNTSNDKWLGGKSSDDWLVENNSLGTLTDWTITIRNGNQFNATCQSGRQISVYENFFMDYSSGNIGSNPGYYCVYLGSCEERIFSSEPHAVPTIDLVGSPIITSSVGQRVRATEAMKLSGSHLAGATKITLSGTNLTFATSATATPAANLEVTVTSGSVAETDIYVYYTPGGGDTSDGIENIIITATDNGTVPAEAKATVSVRHLPADFVIAAKLGDKWYALPNTCNSYGSSTTGVLIEVDDTNDPTSATAAPDNAKWGLRQTKQPARITAGYADRLTFTERGTTETADNQQALYNYNNASVYTNAMWTNYANTNPDRYEWIPVTTNFKDYTLTNANGEGRPLILRNDGEFKAQNNNQAYEGKVRLLPATFYTEAEMQVVEWKASSVVVMYTGSGVTATTKVGSAGEGDAQTLTTQKIDHGVFELTTAQALTDNYNKQLVITIKNGSSGVVGKKTFVIPVIISTDKTADYVVSGADAAEKIAKAAVTDVVILDGKTLSAVATKYTFKNITVYPGGKLVIGAGKQLGMASLTLRGGSSWGAAEYEYKYPQFVLNNATDGAYSNSAAVINYDYVTTKAQYYTFVLPYDASTSAIKYPVDIYGSNVLASNTGSFEFQYYDGAARAAGGQGWTVLPEPATLNAGQGYTFLGMPKKVDAYDGTDDKHSNTRQTYGIHRIPMTVAAGTVQSGETNSDPGKSTSITVTLSDKNNASGWVLVGNPFMGDVTGLDNDDIQVGQLIPTSTVPWDGKWRWNPESSERFVVIPGNDGQTYESAEVSTAELPAFKNFFVQINNSSVTSLVIPASSRAGALLAPARHLTQEEKDVRLAVDLVSETRSDKVDLLINDAYSAGFEVDADFTKMMNSTNLNLYGVYPGDNLSFIAVDKTTASNSIAIGYQVPAGGEYTLRLSDRAYVMSDYVEALFVTDHEVEPEVTTDLLTSSYTFHVNNAETNDTRFTMSIVMAPKTPTDIDMIEEECGKIDPAGALKFLYRDKVYILYNGVVYDSTGKRVREINK